MELTWEFVDNLGVHHAKYWMGHLTVEPYLHVKYTIAITNKNELELRYWKNGDGIFLRFVDSVESGAGYAQKHLDNLLAKAQ